MTLTAIAELYLQMLAGTDRHPQEGMYVRLAYKYGVPVGRIIALTGLSGDVVIAYLEGGA